MDTIKTIVTVYTESTPNPNTLKFVCDKPLIVGTAIEFTDKDQTKNSPLAQNLFNFPFVKSVFFAANFVTITKTENVSWNDIASELRYFITTYLNEGRQVLSEKIVTHKSAIVDDSVEAKETLTSEIDIKIVEILDQYIRPAVEGDGGDIAFKSFKDGIVTVQLKGSCSGCPSSTMTLKMGIEGLLKRMIPEVKEVVQEAL